MSKAENAFSIGTRLDTSKIDQNFCRIELEYGNKVILIPALPVEENVGLKLPLLEKS